MISARLPLAAFFMSFAVAGSAHAACMSKKWEDVAQVPEENRGKAYFVIVAPGDVQALREQGFENAECSELKGAESEYRDAMCEMSDFGNEAVQNQFERALGIRPRKLCETAEKVAGPWAGKAKG